MAQSVLATRPADSSVAPADARATSCAAVTGPCRAARIALQPQPPGRAPSSLPLTLPYTPWCRTRRSAFNGGRSSPGGRSTAVLRPKAHRAQRGYGRRRAPGGSSTGQAQTARPRPVFFLPSAKNAPPGRPRAPAAWARGVQRAAQGGRRASSALKVDRFPASWCPICPQTCPVSTEGGTRRVQLVREGGRGAGGGMQSPARRCERGGSARETAPKGTR